MNTRLTRLLTCSLALLTAGALHLRASDLLIDRGLPTENLNNASGANRSNVSWAFGSDQDGAWLAGDTFTNNSAGTYAIDTIRLWTVGSYDTVSLFGGVEGSASYGEISNSVVASVVTYVGGLSYQGSGGGLSVITQLDFAVNLTLAAGQNFNFFLNGSSSVNPFIPFAHASNAALGGSPADGADNAMLYGLVSGGTIAAADIGTWTSLGNGWDKPSDLNVQVYGKSVPDSGSTLSLLALALVGVAFWRRR